MRNKFVATSGLVIFLLISTASFGQAPNLGTSAGFTLFTATGAFSNTGLTSIIGDIGTNVSTVTGFPPGVLTGSIHQADPVSAQAAIDVEAGYNELTATPCGMSIAAQLGNGQILTPNVYCIGTASALNGSLTLNANGDANAVFIFKITGALTTSSLSRVILINSASLGNVYWQIDGKLILGDNSIFRGSAIVNGAIDLLEGATLFGRGLSRAGAITTLNNLAAIAEPPTLAIRLSAIEANNEGFRNRISWVTESESAGDFVELERSSNGTAFAIISIIQGNAQPSSYIYWDAHPFIGLNLYRLKMKEVSGNFTYSRTVTAIMKAADQHIIEVYPNPAKDRISVIIKGTADNNTVSLSDITGKQMKQIIVRNNKADVSITDLPPGIYFIKYSDGSNSQVIKIVKQ